jgi:putative ABC transport system permease protein
VLGQSVQLGWGGDAPKAIVGVLGNVRHRNLAAPPEPEMYVPVRQFLVRQLFLVAKLESDNAAAKSAWVNRMQQRLPNVNIGAVRWFAQSRDASLIQPKLAAVLFSALALSALFLSAVGLFALMHFLVSLREREFGLRMALGAAKVNIFVLQLRQSLMLVLVGCSVGALLAAAGGVFAAKFLFETKALDAASFMLAIVTMLVSGVIVSLWPSWRASSVNANSILR